MPTPFRQLIRPGDVGRDVLAYKRAYIKMGIKGAGGLTHTKKAGPSFVSVTKTLQHQHNLKQDGICGKATHIIVAPHFDAYGIMLYKTAAIRKPPLPPVPSGTLVQLAQTILSSGKYHADNPGDWTDLKRTALGEAVWSQGGYYTHLDERVLQVILWLIYTESYSIGTFAICSDHHYDGPHGHSGGFAVDISSINGVSVVSSGAHALTLAVAQKLRNAPASIRPRQLICDGYGGMHSQDISNCCIPSAGYYGYTTLSQHRNHIHAGF